MFRSDFETAIAEESDIFGGEDGAARLADLKYRAFHLCIALSLLAQITHYGTQSLSAIRVLHPNAHEASLGAP